MSLRDVGTVKDTTTITLFDPATGKDLLNADGTAMTVAVYGPYSDRYKSVLRAQQQQRVAEITAKGRDSATLNPDEMEAMSRELTLQCIADWNLTLEGDTTLPFSFEAAESVLTEFPWVRDQISVAMGNVGNFLERPKKP